MVVESTHRAVPASEQRYRHLFANLPICIFVVDLTVTPPVIQEVNRRTELIYGYPAAEMVGNPIALLVPAAFHAAAEAIIQRVQRGEMVTAELTNRHRDGTTFPVRVIATLDPVNNGLMITTVEDISAEKRRQSEAEAIDAERLRIAHEIHDGVAQNLAGMRFKSALWLQRAEAAPPEMRSALEEVQAVLTIAIEDIRRAIFALRPLDIEGAGFFPALRQWVTTFGDQNRLVIALELTLPAEDLPAAYELPLFRIIQEGLNNIHQHAQASTALVRLASDGAGGVALLLRDNGRGFDPNQIAAAGPPDHFGLVQMRERIRDLGGSLDIQSAAGQGTDLLIRLPRAAQPSGSRLTPGGTDDPG